MTEPVAELNQNELKQFSDDATELEPNLKPELEPAKKLKKSIVVLVYTEPDGTQDKEPSRLFINSVSGLA